MLGNNTLFSLLGRENSNCSAVILLFLDLLFLEMSKTAFCGA
jgi:hypothetical protein